MPETDAATTVAKIDTTTVEGWNLRALLLRRADGGYTHDYDSDPPEADEACDAAIALADSLRIVDVDVCLTPIGHEVAERLRPEPWRVTGNGVDWVAYCERDNVRLTNAGRAVAGRIAALLTQDDLRTAKTYRTEAP
jgi:hypothetical protein